MKRLQYMSDDEFAAFLDATDTTDDGLKAAMVSYALEGDTAEHVALLREHGHKVEDYPGSSGVTVCNPDARQS